MKKLCDVIEEICNKIENYGEHKLHCSAKLVRTFFLSGLKPYQEFVLVSKEEYLDLLEDKLSIAKFNYIFSKTNANEFIKIKQEIQEKIDCLKS